MKKSKFLLWLLKNNLLIFLIDLNINVGSLILGRLSLKYLS